MRAAPTTARSRCVKLVAAMFLGSACAPSLPRPASPFPAVAAGRHRTELPGGRSYDVHVPARYDGRAELPLVVVLHGAFSGPRKIARETGWNALADREGFVVLYPAGRGLLGLLRQWNSGHCCGPSHAKGVDDVGYVMEAVADASARLRLDRARIYVVGHSNGGMLAHRIAAERSSAVAGAAVVAGTIGGKPSAEAPEWQVPPPARPVPVILVHGRADPSIPYDGGRSRRGTATMISAPRSAAFWVAHDNGAPEPERRQLLPGVLEERWSGDAPVVLVTLEGWEHDWPGPRSTRRLPEGSPLRRFDATEVIWSFLGSRRRP